MTDEEAVAVYDAMLVEFGQLPNFEHYPRQFIFYYKLYKLIQKNDGKSN